MSTILSWTDPATNVSLAIQFDVTPQIHHESTLTITSHPVEKGSDVTDNARPNPEIINFEGYISNKPLLSNVIYPDLFASSIPMTSGQVSLAKFMQPSNKSLISQFGPGALAAQVPSPSSIIASGLGALSTDPNANAQPGSAVLYTMGNYQNRVQLVYGLLKTAQRKRFFVVASTGLEQVDSFLIERVAVPRSPQDGNGATFQIDLKRVRIVQSKTVQAPLPAEARGLPQANVGNKNAGQGGNDKPMLKSVAAGLYDGAKGIAANPGGIISGITAALGGP